MRTMPAYQLTTLLLCFLLAACTPLPESIETQDKRNRPEQVFFDARVEFQERGMVRGVASARRMEHTRRTQTILLTESVEVVSWDSMGRIESLTLCDTLKYLRNRQDLSAEGGVRVMSASDPQGRRLKRNEPSGQDLHSLRRNPPFLLITERLDWVQRIHKIQTASAIKFLTPLDTLRGVGFRSDRNLRNWEIDKPTGVTHRGTPSTSTSRRRNPS